MADFGCCVSERDSVNVVGALDKAVLLCSLPSAGCLGSADGSLQRSLRVSRRLCSTACRQSADSCWHAARRRWTLDTYTALSTPPRSIQTTAPLHSTLTFCAPQIDTQRISQPAAAQLLTLHQQHCLHTIPTQLALHSCCATSSTHSSGRPPSFQHYPLLSSPVTRPDRPFGPRLPFLSSLSLSSRLVCCWALPSPFAFHCSP